MGDRPVIHTIPRPERFLCRCIMVKKKCMQQRHRPARHGEPTVQVKPAGGFMRRLPWEIKQKMVPVHP